MVCVWSLGQDTTAILSNTRTGQCSKLCELFLVVNSNVGNQIGFGHDVDSLSLFTKRPRCVTPSAPCLLQWVSERADLATYEEPSVYWEKLRNVRLGNKIENAPDVAFKNCQTPPVE